MSNYVYLKEDSPEKKSRHETIQFYSEDEAPYCIHHRQTKQMASSPDSSNISYGSLNLSKSYMASTPEYSSKRMLYYSSSDDSGVQSDLWSEISSPIMEFRSKWKQDNRRLYNTSLQKNLLEKIIILYPLVVGLIVISGAIYSVQMAMNGSQNIGKISGKYASILYAHKRVYNSTHPSRILLGDILDESGNVLRGRRAAIQYSFNRRNGNTLMESATALPPKEPSEVVVDNSNNEIVVNPKKKVLRLKKDLVKKMGSFGHFTTTKVEQGSAIRGRTQSKKEDLSKVKVSVKAPEETKEPPAKENKLEPIDFDEVINTTPPAKLKQKKPAPGKTPNTPLSRLIDMK